jgi:hypothetical protein
MTPADQRLTEMDAALARIRQIGEDDAEPDAISYGLLPFDLQEQWDEAVARLRALLDRFSHLAAAESSLDGVVQARSVIGWTGDLVTVWSCAAGPEHRRALFALLDADFRCRARMVQIVTAALAAAASVCAAASVPIKAPAAFRSLMKLVSELQTLDSQAERG